MALLYTLTSVYGYQGLEVSSDSLSAVKSKVGTWGPYRAPTSPLSLLMIASGGNV